MNSAGSVTQWIHQLPRRDQAAIQKIWEAYFPRLVGLARKRLWGTPTQAADAEDVALSAFESFCRRAEAGRFPRLADRDDLWQLLVLITARKACNQARHEARRQPPGGRVLPASALAASGAGEARALFADEISRAPSPERAAQTAEECRRLLATLGDEELRRIALWKLEGYSNEEIAARMGGGEGRSLPTVERKLARIRRRWQKEITP
jgi:DNA-directed RNA polymerase specialized sigma24 family protein